MTIKHIRWVACIGLLAIICLQYVWLVNTYKLTKESIQFRSNEVFRDATMREVFYRMEVYQDSLQKKYKDKDTSIMVRINLDEDYDFFEDGRGDKNVNQWLMSNMQVSMQEIVKRDYKIVCFFVKFRFYLSDRPCCRRIGCRSNNLCDRFAGEYS